MAILLNFTILTTLILGGFFTATPVGAATPTPTPTITPTPTPVRRYSNIVLKQIRIPSEEFPRALFEGEIPYCPDR